MEMLFCRINKDDDDNDDDGTEQLQVATNVATVKKKSRTTNRDN